MTALAVAALAASAGRARAQSVATSLEVGAAGMRYADSLSVSTASLTPGIAVRWPRATLSGTGTFSQLATSGWSSQGALSASLSTPDDGLLSGELAADAGGSAHRDGSRTGQMLAAARAHLDAARLGGWAGAGAGRTWDGFLWRAVAMGELGLWTRAHGALLSVTATPTLVDDSIRYTDAEVALHWANPAVAVDLSGGTRAGARAPVPGSSATTWGAISVTARLTSRAALVAGAGSYPVDLTQGFPGGRYLSLGIRFTGRERLAGGGEAARDAIAASVPPNGWVDGLRVDIGASGQRTLRVHAPEGRQLELMGDMTQWKPVALVQERDGWWALPVPLAAGHYEINVRVDGGAWLVPLGTLPMRDDFGGAVGMLVVP